MTLHHQPFGVLRRQIVASLAAEPDEIELFGALLDAAAELRHAGESAQRAELRGGRPRQDVLARARSAAQHAIRTIEAYEARRTRAEAERHLPVFADVVEALDYWRARDPAPLAAATEPPCDRLGDEIPDAMLAVVFKRLVRAATVAECVYQIDAAIGAYGRAWAREDTEGMIAVLRRWSNEIADAAARAVVEGEEPR